MWSDTEGGHGFTTDGIERKSIYDSLEAKMEASFKRKAAKVEAGFKNGACERTKCCERLTRMREEVKAVKFNGFPLAVLPVRGMVLDQGLSSDHHLWVKTAKKWFTEKNTNQVMGQRLDHGKK